MIKIKKSPITAAIIIIIALPIVGIAIIAKNYNNKISQFNALVKANSKILTSTKIATEQQLDAWKEKIISDNDLKARINALYGDSIAASTGWRDYLYSATNIEEFAKRSIQISSAISGSALIRSQRDARADITVDDLTNERDTATVALNTCTTERDAALRERDARPDMTAATLVQERRAAADALRIMTAERDARPDMTAATLVQERRAAADALRIMTAERDARPDMTAATLVQERRAAADALRIMTAERDARPDMTAATLVQERRAAADALRIMTAERDARPDMTAATLVQERRAAADALRIMTAERDARPDMTAATLVQERRAAADALRIMTAERDARPDMTAATLVQERRAAADALRIMTAERDARPDMTAATLVQERRAAADALRIMTAERDARPDMTAATLVQERRAAADALRIMTAERDARADITADDLNTLRNEKTAAEAEVARPEAKKIPNQPQATEILEKIKQHKSIICTSHHAWTGGPCPDAIGSSRGLAQFIKDNFPEKEVFCDGSGSKDGSHFLESIWKNGHQPTKKTYKDSLVIVTDAAQGRLISGKHWRSAKEKIKIDDHETEEAFADYQWLDPTYNSASEMIGQLAIQSGLHVTPQTANLLLAGIISDTDRFLHSKDWKNSKVVSRTFEIVSFLQEKGADFVWVNKGLAKANLDFLKVAGYICNNLTLIKNGIVCLKITDEILKGYNDADFKLVMDWIRLSKDVTEIKVWILAVEDKNRNTIKISLRSNQLEIHKIAEKYEGGGHKYAAGAKLNHWGELDNLLNDVEKSIEEQEI